jgi:eukaryotic-like serine/threonine-protein kinase
VVDPVRLIGRYALYGEIAAGGMATVHFGRLIGPVGFSRTVAIKRLHPQFAKDPEFVTMFLDEARLAARIRHPNVVATLDVVATDGELFLVMDYVQGESLARLVRRRNVAPRIVASIVCGALHGLHAAHEACDERGEPLDIVHRDVSPQNILVGVDGTARVLDFGVAKASGRAHSTRDGHIKGKIAYMAPEQFRGQVTRQTDVYACAIVTWEALTGKRLLSGGGEMEVLAKALAGNFAPPSSIVPDLPPGFDEVVMRGLAVDPKDRWATAREMALALEQCAGIASPSEVGVWVDSLARESLSKRSVSVNEIEASSSNVMISGLPADLTQVLTPATPPPLPVVEPAPLSAPASAPADTVTSPGMAMTEAPRAPPALGPRAQSRWLVPALAIFGVIALGFALRPLWQGPPAPATQATEASSSLTVAAPPLSATAAQQPSAAPLPALPAATLAPSATAAPALAVKPAATTTTAAPAKPGAAGKKPRGAGCEPPYTIDSAGHKHYKVECF